MRSKRVLTLLLAVCLVFSLVAAPVNAVTTDKADQNGSASNSKENSLLVSGKDTVSSLPTLRDQVSGDSSASGEKPTVNGSQDFQTGDGSWTVEPSDKAPSVSLTDSDLYNTIQHLKEAAEYYAAEDVVSAFIVMDEDPLVDFYGSISDVPTSEEQKLEQQQEAVITLIEENVLDGEELSVITNFTYLTNSLVVSTEFGNLEAIASLPGVKTVFLSPVYYPCATETTTYPQTVSSGKMSNVSDVWNNEDLGYTGKGLTIAVLDTGLDLDHPSFADDPAMGESSWTAEDVAEMLESLDLNASALYEYVSGTALSADDVYYNAKVPFYFNYASGTTNVLHNDGVGDHGTHVSGIAAANAVEGTGVVGMAPDAQIIVMKVFNSETGGANMYDILNALEDAMKMGVDVANLSLGSPAGFSQTGIEIIDEIFANIAKTDLIVDIAAGNEGTSSYGSLWGTYKNTTGNIDNATISSPSTYANAMSVASVDNKVAKTAYFTMADGQQVFYMQSVEYLYGYISYNLEVLAEEGELEYVIVPGLGAEEDFYDAEGNSIVEGKVAVVKRGQLTFSEKAMNAENAGAIACLIWNQAEEDIFSFGMTTSDDDYIPTIPVSLISLADGQKLADAETKTIAAATDLGDRVDPLGGQVSSFSSWGVTPDLRLLPDIAGVGGNIYSCYDGGEYGLMSGTSMATPQVAGITALVLQYLQETFPDASVSELRTLVDSLMMSTAVPVVDADTGLESSPRQQGAGLVNALYAVTSEAYLSVSGSERPKAELYDDENGEYSFTFTIHNFGAEDKTYTLSSSLLCEDYEEWYQGIYFMAEYEHELDNSAVTFSADTITVKAGQTADVTVTIKLTDADKKWIDTYFKNGNYVEGYIYLTSDDAVDMSLPFMGFYGDWNDAPIFDTGYWYDEGFWSEEGVVGEANNFYHHLWTSLGESETDWILGFSPYSSTLYDNEGNFLYDPAHNVISPNGDGVLDQITELYLSLMRNAKYLYITYTDEDGNVLHEDVVDYISKTMYNSSYGSTIPFVYTGYYDNLYDFTDPTTGEYLADGTKLTLTISAELDYEGAERQYMEQIPITIDTSAPVIDLENVVESSDENGNYLTLTVSDYALAAVVLMNPTGTQIYDTYDETMFTDNGDGTYTVKLDVTNLGDEMMVVLCDYGCNEAYYDVTYTLTENLPEMDTSALYAYRVYDELYEYYYGYDYMFGWTTINKETAEVTTLSSDAYEYYAVVAAEYVDGQIIAVDAGQNLIRMIPGLWNRNWICNLGTNVMDMAFDATTGTMYISTKGTGVDRWGYEYEVYTLSTLDVLTGEITELAQYEDQSQMPWAMACVDGQLYATKYSVGGFYKVDMETYELLPVTDAEGNEVVITSVSGNETQPYYSQSMTYGAADGLIYWAYYGLDGNSFTYELITIDPSDYTSSSVPFAWDQEFVGLLTLEDNGYTLPESDVVTALILDQDTLTMAPGEVQELTASLLPWNASVTEDVVWTSEDESVVMVVDGLLYAVGSGSTVVTASYGDATASCVVNVADIKGSMYAFNFYSDDGSYDNWVNVGLNGLALGSLGDSPVSLSAADYNGHDGYVYGYTEAGQFYKCDLATGEYTALGTPVSAYVVDMAYDYSSGFMYALSLDSMSGNNTIWYVNMSTGALVEVATLYSTALMTLACDTNGTLYSIASDGTLYQLSLVVNEWGGGIMPWSTARSSVSYYVDAVPVMYDLGYLQTLQTMCYDHNNNVLLWISAENGGINWVDVENGYVVNLGTPSGTTMIEYTGAFVVPAEIPELDYVPVESVEAEDMVVLEGGAKVPMVSIEPLNATNSDVVYVSADESIAKVENGLILGVSLGSTTVTGTLVDGENTYEFTFTVNVKKGTDNIYGYLATDMATYDGYYLINIPDTDPNNYYGVSYIQDDSAYYMMYAMEYVDSEGYIYGYGYDDSDWNANFQYMTIDPATMTIVDMVDMGDAFPFVYDMAYDYTTGTMYAVAGPSSNSSDLYYVDLSTGKLISCMTTELMFMSLAVDSEGTLYAMAPSVAEEDPLTWETTYSNAVLYAVDVENGTYEPVLDTGVGSNMLASMAYDFDTGYIYWTGILSGNTGYVSGLYLIDLEDGTCNNLGTIGASGSQVTSLMVFADEYPEVPDTLQKLLLTSTMEELAAGDTVELMALLQPNVDVELTWTSSDESVATVDENGVVTGVSDGVAVITVTTVSGGETFTAVCTIVVHGEDDYFLSYNTTDGGFAAITRPDPSGATNLTKSEEVSVKAMEMINGIIYAYDEENNLFWTMEDSGFERHYIGNANVEIPEPSVEVSGYSTITYTYGFVVRDMAWDAANGRMLAVGREYADAVNNYASPDYSYSNDYQVELDSGCKLYEVDLETGALTELCVIGGEDSPEVGVSTLAVTGEGEIYILSTFMDYISKVDPETGVLTKLTTFQNQGVYPSSDGEPMAMTYDSTTNMIYVMITSNGTYYQLYTFNVANTVLTYVGNMGEVIYDADNWTYIADAFAGLVVNQEHVHDYVENVTQKPTCTEDGSVTYTCQCGHSYTEDIKATGHTYVDGVCSGCGAVKPSTPADDDSNPNTGDAFTALWAIALMVSVTGAAVLVLDRKKWSVK